MISYCRVAVFAFALSFISAGCGGSHDGVQKYQVSGQVHFAGEPVAEGEVVFRPVNDDGTPSAGKIKDGKFICEVTPGEKTVEISANRPTGKKGLYGEDEIEQYIPAEFNSRTTLSASVAEDGANVFNFDLKATDNSK